MGFVRPSRLSPALALLCLVLMACGGSSPSSDAGSVVGGKVVANGEALRVVRYQGGFVNLPAVVAAQRGFFSAHGLNVQLIQLTTGAAAAAAVLGGSLDVALSTSDTVLTANEKGANFEIIASDMPKVFYTLEVAPGVNLPHGSQGYPAVMQDLKGLKAAVLSRGDSSERWMRSMLTDSGNSGDSMTYVALGTTAAIYAAMTSGRIQVMLAFEPLQTLCSVENTCRPIVDLRQGQGPQELTAANGAFDTFFASADYVNQHKTVIAAFTQAIDDAMHWMQTPANSSTLFPIAKAVIGSPAVQNPDAAVQLLLNNNLSYFGVGVTRTAVVAIANYLVATGSLQSASSAANAVYVNAPQPGG